MEIPIIKKKRFFLLAFLLSLYSAFGICLDISKTNPARILKRFEVQNGWVRLYANLMISMKQTTAFSVLFSVVFLFLFLIFCFVFAQKYKKLEVFVCSVLAFLYSCSIWLGIVFTKSETWDIFIKNKYLNLKNLLFISGWFFLFLGLLLLLNIIAKKCWWDISSTRTFTKKRIVGVFAITALVIAILWLPYYIIFQPGIIHGDVPMQVLQYYRFPVMFQKRWVSDGIKVIFTNDHPFLHTVLFGKALDFGLKMNSLHAGIRLFATTQMICFVFAYAGLITSLYYFKVNRSLLIAAVILYGIIPIFPMYAMFIGGDSFLAFFFICFMITIIWLYQTKGAILKSKIFMACQFLTILFLGIAKNQGIYIAFVTVFFAFIFYRKYWKNMLIAMVLPFFVFYIGYQGFLFQSLHVEKVGKQEALSFFFQQTARSVKYHEDEITQEEKEVIDKVLTYDLLASRYDRDISDPIKRNSRENISPEDFNRYFSTWFKMARKYPMEYMQAFIGNTWRYYSPLSYDASIYYHGISTIKFYAKTRESWTKGVIPQEFIKKMDWDLSEKVKNRRNIMYHFLLLGKYIPVISWFVLPGWITWIMFLCFLILWTKKNYRTMICFLPLFLVLGICLLSPVNGNTRYLLPAYTLMPVMIAMTIGGRKDQ